MASKTATMRCESESRRHVRSLHSASVPPYRAHRKRQPDVDRTRCIRSGGSRRSTAAIYLFSVDLKLREEKMSRSLKTALFVALCGAFFIAATTSVSAGPMRPSLPPEDFGSTSFVQKAGRIRPGAAVHPPEGKRCIKWTRRFSSTHGLGQRRCVHWK